MECVKEKEVIDTEEKSLKEIMMIEAMKKIKDPYKNINVEYVANDLNIGINKAYELFKRKDFPAIRVGKQKSVTLVSYLIWKTEQKY